MQLGMIPAFITFLITFVRSYFFDKITVATYRRRTFNSQKRRVNDNYKK